MCFDVHFDEFLQSRQSQIGKLHARFAKAPEGSRGFEKIHVVSRIWGLGFGVWSLGFRVDGLGCGVWGLVFGVWGLVSGVWGLVSGVWSLVFWVWDLVFGDYVLWFEV